MKMNHDDSAEEIAYVPLAHFANSVEAGMVCELLTNNGVRALLRGATFGGLEPLLIPGGFSEITLEVAEPDFQRAQELYDAFFAEPPPQAVAEAEEAADEDGR
jgi:hypothetical protein